MNKNAYTYENEPPETSPNHVSLAIFESLQESIFDEKRVELKKQYKRKMTEEEKDEAFEHQYQSYIMSTEWQQKRQIVRELYKANNWSIECLRCGTKNELALHHNYYNYGYHNENLSDLDYLCKNCHLLWHSKSRHRFRQNESVYENFDFYATQRSAAYIYNLLSEKVQYDEKEILQYFQKTSVQKYEEYLHEGMFKSLYYMFKSRSEPVPECPPAFTTYSNKRKSLQHKQNILTKLRS